jgi:nitrite reductase (NADH) large subunit
MLEARNMYIIIGQGIAGATAANTLRKLDPENQVTVITDEIDYLYSRVDLPDIIAGTYEPAAAVLQKAEDFANAGINCLMGERVTAVVPSQKTVDIASGNRLKYDKLLIATGSLPVIPKLSNSDSPGVYSLWTMRQAKAIIAAAAATKNAVVVGAGLIGLKTALALRTRGLNVTVIEKLQRVMPRQLDDTAAEMLANRLRISGVEIKVNTGVDSIITAKGVVNGVDVDGSVLPADMVIMAVGVKPNIGLAVNADIRSGHGITVDELQQTSVSDIYAAGDAAETIDSLTGTLSVPAIWPVAVEQGRTAAYNMAGQKKTYNGKIVAMNAVDVAGIPLVSLGDIEGQPGDDILIAHRHDAYRKIVMRDKVVRGVLCLGEIRQAGVLGALISRQVEMEEIERLVSPYFSFADLIAV